MPVVKMPDGANVAFPDDMPADQIKALILKKFPDAGRPTQPQVTPEAAPAPGPMDFLTQGLSGLNEGIAAGLGAPVDLATAGINLATTGINKLAGTDLPQIEHPVGGSETFRSVLSPTIKPESDNAAEQMTRRVTKEVGAMLIPGAKPIAMAEKPLKVAAKELTAAIGSGSGAAIAQQVAPDNPLAELVGQLLGGLSPTAAESTLARGAAKKASKPSLDQMRAETDAAYKVTRDLGVAYTPQAYDTMLGKVAKQALDEGISPERHKAAYSFIMDMAKKRGEPLSLTELDQLRQRVRRDLITPSYGNQTMAADAHFGEAILDGIDEMISGAKPADLAAGSPAEAMTAILNARASNSRLRKSEMLADALYKARLQTESTGSGGNINNAIRQQIKGILTNPKRVAAFTKEERATMEELVKQGKLEGLLRLVGKLSPSGNGLMAALGIGGTIVNPAAAAVPAAGMIAKTLADRGTISKAEKLQRKVAQKPIPETPALTNEQKQVLAALTAAQASTQPKQPIQITVRGGAR